MRKENYIEFNREVYDLVSNSYGKKRDEKEEKIKKDVVEFARYVESRFSDSRILEIDSNAGIVLREFESRGFINTGIDLSSKMIEVASKYKYINNHFLRYNFGNEQFYGIFARSVIHLFPLKELPKFIEKSYEFTI